MALTGKTRLYTGYKSERGGRAPIKMTIYTHLWEADLAHAENPRDPITVTIDTNTGIVDLSTGERFHEPFTHGYGGEPDNFRPDVFARCNLSQITRVIKRTHGPKTFLGIYTERHGFFGFKLMLED